MGRIGLALAVTAFVAGCETGDDDGLPDAYFVFDGGRDGSAGGPDAMRWPDAAVDPCASPGSTIGNPCETPEQCQDGCFCNGREVCTAGTCAAGANPCVDAVDCSDEACLEETDQCFFMPQHERCSDSDACNGAEVCDPMMGCRAGAPLYCNDENSCTVDTCDTTMGCTYEVRDLDGDGYTDGRCGGMDCDDDPRFGTMIYPGATEVCTNRRDDNCDGFRDYADPACRPMNDTCDTAQFLPGAGTYSGSTDTPLTANYTIACFGTTGPDSVFRFVLTEPHDVRVTVAGGAGRTIGVAIRPFASCATGPDEKCSASTPPSLLRRSLPAGEWAIIVKSNAGVDFDLTLQITDPTPVPLVDRCDGTTQDVSAGGTFTGMFEEVGDDYRLSCNPSVGYKDAAYRFVVPAGASKDVTITGSVTGSGWMPSTYLSITTDCASTAASLACVSATTAMIRRREMPPGTYYILLESNDMTATSWNLTVTITDPAPRAPADACSSAVNITNAAGSMPPVTGSAVLGGMELDYGTSCGGSTAGYRDAVFYFDVPAGGADVTLDTWGFGTAYVATETTCGVRTSEIRCRSGSGTSETSPFRQSWRSMTAGRYYVIASTVAAAGTGSARATITTPPTMVPPNDTCTGPTVIDPAAAPVTIMGDLTGYEDNVGGCMGSSLTDVIYTFTLPSARFTTIVATRITGTGNITLTLRGTCASGASTGCTAGNPATIAQMLAAGTYYLVVEMPLGAEGQYRLQFI